MTVFRWFLLGSYLVTQPALSYGLQGVQSERIPAAKVHSVILILSDDHRHDAMSFMGHAFVETPAMDRLAREGVHLASAFVTTSLCSPSRASILTGLYAHQHKVINNQFPGSSVLLYFPEIIQAAGYATAFVGKWHMGGASNSPQRGFDHCVSFRGQGSYYPRTGAVLNVNGRQVPQEGYITDELTQYAVEWLEQLEPDRPFFLYLSHKAVHGDFEPAKRHAGRYANVPISWPQTYAPSEQNYATLPRWVKTQRNSTHTVPDFLTSASKRWRALIEVTARQFSP